MNAKTRRDFLKITGTAVAVVGTQSFAKKARADTKLKIGVVYGAPIAEIGWNRTHHLAVEALRAQFGDKVEITEIESISQPQDAERVFHDLAASGSKLLFGTSFDHGTPMQKVAKRFPDVAFEHCTGIVQLPNLGTFEARAYEGTFVCGAAAAHVSKTGKIGFISAFPIPDVLGTGNALLLGAQSVNPAITCNTIFLNSWYDPGKEKEAANTLVAQGCDVVCAVTDTATSVQAAGEKGAWSIGFASDMTAFGNGKHVTSFLLDWSPDYVRAARDVVDGSWKGEDHWGGLKVGTVKLSPYNSAIPLDVQAKLKQLEADISAGKVQPYGGEIQDQDGNVKVVRGSVLSDSDLRGMNWFVKGMVGKLT